MLTVRAAAIAQGTLLFCAMGACAPAPRTIGVSIQNLHSEFYTAVENGIRNDAGNNAVDVRDAESDAEQQNEVEASIARNVDAIAIVPVDSTMIGSAALEANTAKIPVFMADINSTSIDSTVAAYIASNNFQGGASGAESMCVGVHGHGSVAIIARHRYWLDMTR
ncbi:MAG: substrate-binding domain-containing protein [Candidatus Cybelea sp.]|jgi:ABC-type sugar transport system substrate-binding protein